jgi:hypothetical protein
VSERALGAPRLSLPLAIAVWGTRRMAPKMIVSTKISANNQVGRRTELTGELPAERRVIQKPATQFAQALEAAFHRRLRKCSLSVLRDELVRRRLLRKNGDAWELTPKGKKELAALKAAKARGKRLGNPRLSEARRHAAVARKEKADRYLANVLPVIRQIQASGIKSLRGVARALAARGVATARGGAWTPVQVSAILQRAK